uniref:Uncharacterized protein n=1 Tax=Vespula pensylvanica TaxID=30213 RepID=A0A834JWL1_VESPE|nr:hypothetical protein H0235_016824 [Vespula pensylvanica]
MIQKMNSFIHIGMCAVYAYITIHASFLQSIPLLEELFSEFDPGILKFLTMWNVKTTTTTMMMTSMRVFGLRRKSAAYLSSPSAQPSRPSLSSCGVTPDNTTF